MRDFERGWRPCPGRGRTAVIYAARLQLLVINVVSSAAAHFCFCPNSGHIAALRRSATKSADARRGARLAVNFTKLLGLVRRSPPISKA